jgi:hypothetical protein
MRLLVCNVWAITNGVLGMGVKAWCKAEGMCGNYVYLVDL